MCVCYFLYKLNCTGCVKMKVDDFVFGLVLYSLSWIITRFHWLRQHTKKSISPTSTIFSTVDLIKSTICIYLFFFGTTKIIYSFCIFCFRDWSEEFVFFWSVFSIRKFFQIWFSRNFPGIYGINFMLNIFQKFRNFP